MGFNSGLKVPNVLPAKYDTGSGLTLTVGNFKIAEVNKAGATVDFESVADISSPSAWTEVVSVSGKSMIVLLKHSSAAYFLHTVVNSAEDAGDAIRIQILIDSTIAFDSTLVKDASDVTQQISMGNALNITLECDETFVVRCARKGTMTQPPTIFKLGEIQVISLA